MPSRGQKRKDVAIILFDPAQVGKHATPPTTTRQIWMFLSLIRYKQISFARYFKQFDESERTFQRDMKALRAFGDQFGFTLLGAKNGGVYRLGEIADMPDDRKKIRADAADSLRAVTEALGALVGNDLSAYFNSETEPADTFLRIATPVLVAGTDVAARYRDLRLAWHDRAKVRFAYPKATARGTSVLEEREVEPHLVTYYGGRYYLVAYDRRPRTTAWRQFALDKIEGRLTRTGSFVARTVPAHYSGADAVGLFKSGAALAVTIALSPRIAGAVVARRWQRGQQTTLANDGSARITFDVHDVGEAVRWAFGFGAEARVIAPQVAVRYARELAAAMARTYGDDDIEHRLEA